MTPFIGTMGKQTSIQDSTGNPVCHKHRSACDKAVDKNDTVVMGRLKDCAHQGRKFKPAQICQLRDGIC
jgi:hypothetical protein